jgi:MoaA/NifB/PqqE/SkfB family radical SAM enzyme
MTSSTDVPSKIEYIDWAPSGWCDLSCDFCDGVPHGLRPTAETQDRIVEALISSDAATVTICGGEPFGVRRLYDYASRLKAGGKQVNINTNGILLRRRVEQGFDLNVADSYGISVHSFTQSGQVCMQGPEANLAETVAAAMLVCRSNAALKVATVVSRVNYQHVPWIATKVIRELQPDIWRLYQYYSGGPENINQADHTISDIVFDATVLNARSAAGRIKPFPIPVVASTSEHVQGCVLVYPNGLVYEPTPKGHAVRGNLLLEPLDSIWKRITNRATVSSHKDLLYSAI